MNPRSQFPTIRHDDVPLMDGFNAKGVPRAHRIRVLTPATPTPCRAAGAAAYTMFEKVRALPIFLRWTARFFFLSWIGWVRHRRNGRRRVALMRAFRMARDDLEAKVRPRVPAPCDRHM